MCLEEEDPSDNVRFIVMNIVEVENEAVQQEESRSTSFGAARRTPDSRHLQYTMTIRCFDSGNFSFYYMGFGSIQLFWP